MSIWTVTRTHNTVRGPHAAGDPVSVRVEERFRKSSRRGADIPNHQSLKQKHASSEEDLPVLSPAANKEHDVTKSLGTR